ncbi:MAG TPA: ABC transporter ATP-binding protein [Lachnospiraceae bacterium]|nr:ABC transporter ATP-binding protein [Lachnospiraceae bacterium]
MVDVAIDVSHVTKLYKLYANPSDRFKESLGLSKKKRYKELYALSDVSFNVKRGECVGIIGTNGSGKSTILKIITGVLSPTGGTVSVSGRISALLELGAGFNPEYTGLENIYVNGTVMGFSKEEVDARLDEIVNFADIGDFIRQPVKTYSSGMFVRLAFAVAINIDPEILIVDEALSVGDVFFQAKCYHKFEEFKREGKTILFVSHDLSSVAKYCDRVILLNKGVKKTEGGAKAVIDIYKQILVNTPIADDRSMIKENISRYLNTENAKGKWYSRLEVNPSVLDYGEKQAEIVDFALIDDQGEVNSGIVKGRDFIIRMKVHFNEDLVDPLFCFTIKDPQGTEVTGTNTMYEGIDTGDMKAGTDHVVDFKQNMNLQGRSYLLSLGVVGFARGKFTVYHRLYDICDINVISEKNTVGFYDMNSSLTIDGEEKKRAF